MSNGIVGDVYTSIIEKVIAASQVDFEESGVDQQTLQELQQMWQQNLSRFNIAHFPWDPAPQTQINPPTLPSNVKAEPSPVPPSAPPQPAYGVGGVQIKQEPSYENNIPGYRQMNGYSGLDGMAQQRAQRLLHQNFGQRAEASIGALGQHQGGLALPGQRQFNLQLPGSVQARSQPSQAQQQQSGGLSHSQTDGAGDGADSWSAVLADRSMASDDGPGGRLAADHMMRQQLEHMSQVMDSGLMVPLERGKRRRGALPVVAGHDSVAGPSHSGMPEIPQLDGEQDDRTRIELDEDAINSDLDDSDAEADDDDDEQQEVGETMLCTYDKVARVKNKWKCTLKDGILTTNGKEYLFHKAQGEFEW